MSKRKNRARELEISLLCKQKLQRDIGSEPLQDTKASPPKVAILPILGRSDRQ
jgi:hypothetical protein